MVDHDDNVSLTEITMTDPVVTQQNQMIAQLMQQITDMKVEMTKLANIANVPTLHFPSPHQSIPISTNLPMNPAGPSNIYPQTPPSLQNPNITQACSSSQIANTTQTIPPENRGLYQYNLQATQIESPKIPFHAPVPLNLQNPHATHSEEREKELKAKQEMSELDIEEKIAKAVKKYHYASNAPGLDYENLCIHPELNLPEGFKVPKFDTFNGSGNPLAHLRAYCDQLVGVGENEALLMRLFSRSLSGKALVWFTSQDVNRWASWSAMAKDFVENFAYNVEIAPDRYSLERIKQKSTESYREYAYRWRETAAGVQPPMSEKEIVEAFVRSQGPEFYDRMILLVGAKFADIVKIGEKIEDGLKTGKIGRISTSTEKSGMVRKREEDVSAISGIQNKRITPRSRPNYHQVPSAPQNKHDIPKADRKPPRVFTPLAESRTRIFERLSVAGLIQPVPPKVEQTNSHFVEGDRTCAYHSNSVGHDTEDCISLRHKIQDLIDCNTIVLQTIKP